MPTVVNEFVGMQGIVPVYSGPPIQTQTPLTASGASQTFALAFTGQTTVIRVDSDEAIHVAIGAAPVATTSMPKIIAKSGADFGVQPGHKIAIIAGT
jgi:hypothetical protein